MVERLRRAMLRRAIRRSGFVTYAGQVWCFGRRLWEMRE
jgi:D-alanyl-D-alanine dipeptidase